MSSSHFRDMLMTASMQADMATALYAGRDAFNDLARKVGARNCRYSVIAHHAAGWIKFGDHAHLSVCGSNDGHDWIQNLSADQVECNGLLMHRGFASAARWIGEALVRDGLRQIGGLPLVIGGHSAGGVIAEALAIRWEPRELVTFGAPRAWCAQSATIYRALPWPVYRFVTTLDPVPAFPLRRFRRLFRQAKYAHASAAMELLPSGEVLMEQETSWARRAVRLTAGLCLGGLSVVPRWGVPLPQRLLRHHHAIARYSECLDAAMKRNASQVSNFKSPINAAA